MKVFFLLFLIPVFLVPAYASSGSNFDVINNGDGTTTWKAYLYDRIFDGDKWTPYILTETPSQIKFEAASGSFILNKITCEWQLFEKGQIKKEALVNTRVNIFKDEIRQLDSCIVSAVNEQPTHVKFSISKDGQVILFDLGAGGIEWTYDLRNTDRKQTTFKFKEIYPVPDLEINGRLFYGDYVLNTKNEQHGTLKGINQVNETLQVEYEKVLGDGEKFLIDPTWSQTSTAAYDGGLTDNGNNDLCDGNSFSRGYSTAPAVRVYATGLSTDCIRVFFEWVITSFPDDVLVTDIDLVSEIQTVTNPRTCDVVPLSVRPSVSSDSDLWNAFDSATDYVTGSNFCQTVNTNINLDLGEQAVTDFQNAADSGKVWFSLGVMANSELLDTAHYMVFQAGGTGTPDPTLEVTYETPYIYSVDDLSITDTRATAVDLSWSTPQANATITGYRVNYTTPHSENVNTVIISDTGNNDTSVTVSGLTGETDYSFRVTGLINNLGNITFANVVNTTTNFDPTGSFSVGTFDVDDTNTDLIDIAFDETQINDDDVWLNVTYDDSYDLACTFSYKFAVTNRTYDNLSNVTVDSNRVRSDFRFNDVENEVIGVRCWDQITNNTGNYVLTQSNFELLKQIDNFRNGTYGTTGQFGALDFITLAVIMVSMIGFNRVNEAGGIIFGVIVTGVAAFFEIIAWPSILTASIALVIMIGVASTKKP